MLTFKTFAEETITCDPDKGSLVECTVRCPVKHRGWGRAERLDDRSIWVRDMDGVLAPFPKAWLKLYRGKPPPIFGWQEDPEIPRFGADENDIDEAVHE